MLDLSAKFNDYIIEMYVIIQPRILCQWLYVATEIRIKHCMSLDPRGGGVLGFTLTFYNACDFK